MYAVSFVLVHIVPTASSIILVCLVQVISTAFGFEFDFDFAIVALVVVGKKELRESTYDYREEKRESMAFD